MATDAARPFREFAAAGQRLTDAVRPSPPELTQVVKVVNQLVNQLVQGSLQTRVLSLTGQSMLAATERFFRRLSQDGCNVLGLQ